MAGKRHVEMWLWSRDFEAIQGDLVGQVRAFPELPCAEIESYCDGRRSDIAVLRLRCEGGAEERSKITTWAEAAGFRATDSTSWSKARRENLLAQLAPYEPNSANQAMTHLLADLCACLVVQSRGAQPRRPAGSRTRLAKGTGYAL